MDLRGPQPPPGRIVQPSNLVAEQPPHETPAANPALHSTMPLRSILTRAGACLLVLLIVGLTATAAFRRVGRSAPLGATDFATASLPLEEIAQAATSASSQSLSVNGRLNVNGSVVVAPSVQPSAPVTGQLYYDQTSNQLAVYNGTTFQNLAAGGDTIQNTTNLTTINNISNVTNAVTSTAAGTVISTGAPGSLVKFATPTSLSNSLASESSDTLSVAGNINLTSQGVPGAELTGFSPTDAPVSANNQDLQPVELGIKFRTDVSGFVRGIRFYKGSLGTGTHTGTLWDSSGSQLATVTFTGESASGWQEARFATPVAISSDSVYIASYHVAGTAYGADNNYFQTSGRNNGVLHILQNGDDGANGVFKYSSSTTFPSQGFSSTNYWADVIFAPNPTPNRYQVNGVQISSSDLSNNSSIAKRGSSQIFTGSNTFRNSVNSTSTFAIQATSGTVMFSVDTINGALVVGPAAGDSGGILLVLGNKTSVGDPPGIEGAMYFNSASRTFRCFRYNEWDNCAQLEVDHAFTLYDEFMGGQSATLGGTGSIGELGWTAMAIGAHGSLSFNPAVPAPTADRPGVLQLTTPAAAGQGSTLALGTGAASMLPAAGITIKTGVAVGSATSGVLRVGLHGETTTTTQPVSGLWWEANPAVNSNWLLCYGNGTTAQCDNSNRAIVPDAWVSLQARINSINTSANTASLTFLIDGAFIERPSAPFSIANRLSPAFTCYATAAVAHTCDWDYFQLKGTTSVRR